MASCSGGLTAARRHHLLLAAAFCLALLAVGGAHAAVFSVDFGSESIKVAVVNLRPGQSPIAIALNEFSKRKSPALAAYSNGERLLSEEAAGIAARYPERVYARARDMLAKPAADVASLLASSRLPYDIVADAERNAVKIRAHDGETELAPEEVVAMVLGYARDLAEAHTKAPIKDAVVSVPPFFGQAQRQALLDAAQVAGVNVMALIHEHAGAALQYGIDKDFSNGSRNVVLFDMGATSTYAAVVHFSSYVARERGKNVSVNQFQVKGVRWETELGGQTMEGRLLDHFAAEFNAQLGGGLDVTSSPKAMAKLKKQVKRTKEILSANTAAPISAESLFEDHDFRSSITREKFEELCGDLWERALTPLRRVLADTNLSVAELDAVELIGGATRVPKLQSVLAEFLGDKKSLDRHLDADEALALGSALLAANISDGFKLNRKIGMLDGLPYGVLFGIEGRTEGADEDAPEEGPQLLFPRLKKLPSKVLRSVKGQLGEFKVVLQYDPEGDVPPAAASGQIAVLEVTGVANATAKYGSYNLTQPLKTALHFALSRSGIVSLDRAEVVAEFSEWFEVPDIPAVNATVSVANATAEGGNGTGASNATTIDGGEGTAAGEDADGLEETPGEEGGLSADEGVTGAEGGVEEEKKAEAGAEAAVPMKRKLRKRTVRIPLKIRDVTEGVPKPLSAAAMAEALKRTEKLRQREQEKRATAEAKNGLEAYIYATKDKLEDAEGVVKVSTEEQRDAFRAELSEAEDWLYMDGADSSAAEFRKKLADLRQTGDAIFFRLAELTARPEASTEARNIFSDVRQVFEEWSTSRPWLNQTDKSQVLDKVVGVEKWLEEVEASQAKLPGNETPVYKSADVKQKVEEIQRQVARLMRIPKPKPKPSPDASRNITKNSTNGSSEGPEGSTGETSDSNAKIEFTDRKEGKNKDSTDPTEEAARDEL